ncbi:MAG: hypothetical protein HN736_15470 [Anaerolineae bacterium]|jgi:sec-independent protein translocase protein TatA|nr:hypothetical protein [Anaerolineae bacterium]MBT7018153.1 hypothetical protein [Anaerolineae bacterium]MBT7602216.1 hypothetical protein [Anaerolineae bacterium]MBT7776090.1 hypothetical protein [Anaerolineae bacterium]
MDILGIGIPELAFIILIALIVLGPKDMQKAGKTIGTSLRKIITSSEWRTVKDISHKVSTLPHQWMRDANEDIQKFRDDIAVENLDAKDTIGSWNSISEQKKNVEREEKGDLETSEPSLRVENDNA